MNHTDTVNENQAGWLLVFAAWLVAAAATAGSLFLSNVMSVPVCELCWYQRIFLYPFVVILAVGLFPWNPGVLRSAGAFVVLGLATAMFHLALIAGLIPESARPCVQGIPCSESHFYLFGVLNIPTLSLMTFGLIGVLLYLAHRTEAS